ncbi:MAG TPA: hypothetical protein PKL54_01940 [Candidatus Hydrogenedentes bacterium]|nr:hypothetical protein [Candidatus Hydrogenedentota bacterium]
MTASALFLAVLMVSAAEAPAEPAPRWALDDAGGIVWRTDPAAPAAHEDTIEMSGRRVSFILRYGVDKNGALTLNRQMVWPMLRTVPNNTHASLSYPFANGVQPEIKVDGRKQGAVKPDRFLLEGLLDVTGTLDGGVELRRTLFPSPTLPAVLENFTLTNTSGEKRKVSVDFSDIERRTQAKKGVDGEYVLTARLLGGGRFTLKPGESARFSLVFSGRKSGEPPLEVNPEAEESARRAFVADLWRRLRFECPEPELSRAFAFAKIRAAESIFATKGGLMHGPGGGAYYAAIWANDQAEYANPFFPFLGDEGGNESSLNAYRHFARFMNDAYAPIPSSIIAEGTDIWNGAGDRGDAAMIAYGAARFALARGDRAVAEELWPLIEWCLEYCRRKTTPAGVIASDCDELERRFPAGDANLCTATLAYDAHESAARLAGELGKPAAAAEDHRARAAALRAAINSHFGATVDGFDTYRYYDGNTTLRAWICIPLVMGIFDRREGTVEALFSPRLWTPDGLATESGKETFWDRATLYAFRGVFHAGDTGRALDYFRAYSRRRLLGEHVPYPVEAWPEGNQRHLSAESALYCRVVTEGLFGVRPAGLRAFECLPRLPEGWDTMALRDVAAFGGPFDLVVTRAGDKLAITVLKDGAEREKKTAAPGETVRFDLE